MGLNQKTHLTRNDVNYTYWTCSAKGTKPTLLLLQGCPDDHTVWNNLIANYLLPNGYGVIAPDLIGYGQTSKPDDVKLYAGTVVGQDLVEILEAESISKVIAAGHDIGAYLASRFAMFQPGKLAGLITLGTAMIPPAPFPFDQEQIRAMQEATQGYHSMWYFQLFLSKNGHELIDAKLENMFTALHGGGEVMKHVCCEEGAMVKWLEDDRNADKAVLPHASEPGFREEWIGRLKRDGWKAPLLWYKAFARDNLDLEAEKAVVEGGRQVINAPYLFVAALNDPLALPDAVQMPISQGMLPDATIREVQGSHWLMLENPVGVGEAIIGWLKNRF